MVFDLPLTFKDYVAVRKKYEKCVSYNYPPDVKAICRYSGPAVFSNRSCGDVIIMMAGRTGAGKSETINELFNKEVCQVGENTSQTKSVKEIEVPVIVRDYQYRIKIPLKFVDVPGARDVNESVRNVNQENIKKYLKTSPNLSPRSNSVVNKLERVNQSTTENSQEVLQTENNPRNEYRKVLPNLILLVIHATDNRMDGENSEMVETLKLLRSLDIVDRKKLNLMVVVTHAASMPHKHAASMPHKHAASMPHEHAASMPDEQFSEEVQRKRREIREILVDVLGTHVKETRIVFVENEPKKWGLEKVKDGDFYMLPDNTLSHLTLIQEMINLFLTNGDILGGLACAAYFSDKNSENTSKKVNVTEMGWNDNENTEDCAMDQVQLDLIQELPLQFLAHGFCPIKGLEKSNTVLARAGTKDLFIGKTYSTHSLINDHPVDENEKTICVRLSQDTLEEYNREKLKRYGLKPLESGTSFSLARVKDFMYYVFSRKSKESLTNDSYVMYLYEFRIHRVGIENNCQSEYFSEELNASLKQLPAQYDKKTEPMFREFFNDWGSHFVQSSYLGGSIRLILPASVTLNHTQLPNELSDHFKILMKSTENPPLSFTSQGTDSSQIGLIVTGGIPPQISHLNELTSEILQGWIRTIELHPVELQDFMTLKPYYLLTEEPLKDSLKEATHNYIHVPHQALPETRENLSNALVTVMTTDSVTTSFADGKLGTILQLFGLVTCLGLSSAAFVAGLVAATGISAGSVVFGAILAILMKASE